MEEFEIKFLEVDVIELEKKLLEIGAKKVGEYDYTRVNFDYPDFSLRKIHAWIRLRTDGKETTLSYKQNLRSKIVGKDKENIGCKEIEVVVDDYNKTFELLKVMGFIVNVEEKNKRIRYAKDDVAYDIDFWPFIPPYVEIESTSHEKAYNAAKELGFNPKDGLIGSAGTVYKKYGYDLDDFSSVTFGGMIKK